MASDIEHTECSQRNSPLMWGRKISFLVLPSIARMGDGFLDGLPLLAEQHKDALPLFCSSSPGIPNKFIIFSFSKFFTGDILHYFQRL